jgi:N-acetylated-alpha-linked acidic dipeptidase
MIREKQFTYAADPLIQYFPPKPKDDVPYLDFSPLQNALATLEQATEEFKKLESMNPVPNTNLVSLNKILYQAEQSLMEPDGLPRRPWYKHTVYAPGLYTGYGVKTLPGVREAIEQRYWVEAQAQIKILAEAITRYSQEVEKVNKLRMAR